LDEILELNERMAINPYALPAQYSRETLHL
jgi:hypothetical protein